MTEGKRLAFKIDKNAYVILTLSLIIVLFIGNTALAVFFGILFSLAVKPKKNFLSIKIGTLPLQAGIVFLGATISLPYAWSVGSDYFAWISAFVVFTFFLGLIIGKLLNVQNRIAFLLSEYGELETKISNFSFCLNPSP